MHYTNNKLTIFYINKINKIIREQNKVQSLNTKKLHKNLLQKIIRIRI